jgi:murein DD-endopeptidase MepM/ murein hydrolase activator NlpD
MLLAQGAVGDGFALTEVGLSLRIANLVGEMGGEAQLADWQARMGCSPEDFRADLRRAIAAAWERDRILASVPDTADQVHARQILVVDPTIAAKLHDELQHAELVWDDLAAVFDPQFGGDLGWFPRGYLTQPAVEEAAFALQPGQISAVVTSALGYHLVKVTAVQKDRRLTPDQRRALQHQALAGWLQEQKAKSRIVVDIEARLSATDPAPVAPVDYIAQPGDSFELIGREFRVSVGELARANPEMDADGLAVGEGVVIPGRSAPGGKVEITEAPAGQDVARVARKYRLPQAQIVSLNRLTSPAQLFAGSALILPAGSAAEPGQEFPALKPGETMLELAARLEENPWAFALASETPSPAEILPGQLLWLPTQAAISGEGLSAPLLDQVIIDSKAIEQGGTVVIEAVSHQPVRLSGQLDGRELHFFEVDPNRYVAIQGIHAMAEPGLTAFALHAQAADGQVQDYEQSLWLAARDFVMDPPLEVDPVTIDPAVTGPEDALIASIVAPASAEKLWSGPFGKPVDPSCKASGYGNRRSFNGSDYIYFHGGLDWGLCDTKNIFAPAPGVVVYTGQLTVRGNATILDHGWGIYTGYWHQSEIGVQVGLRVEAGQVIGQIGATGRVTGDHLHWEIWAGGVQVDPLVWLREEYP